MAFLKKLFGKDPEALRRDAEAAMKARNWGDAKIAWQQLLDGLSAAAHGERDAVRAKIGECQTELVRAQLAEADKQRAMGNVETAIDLCRAAIEMADGLEIKAEVKAKADALTEENVRASEMVVGAPTTEDVFLALSGAWSEEQADELYSYGDEFKQAFLALHDGKADEAREVFRRIVQAHPDALHIKLELARALVASRRRATPATEPAADQAPADEAAKAKAEEEAKAETQAAYEEAAALFRGYLEHEPEEASDELYATVQSELAQVFVELGDMPHAEECLLEAADATHEQTYGHLNLGHFYRVQKRYDEAIQRLDLAVEKMGTVTPDIRVYRELGLAHRDAGHIDEAIDCLKAVIEHQASIGSFDFDPETAETLAALHLSRGEKEEASDLYRHLAAGRNITEHYRYHLLAGKLLKEVGRKADGVRELHAAHALAPDDKARAEIEALLGGKG